MVDNYKQRRKRYIKEYQWSNIYAMLKNNRLDPKVCTDDCKGQLVVITGATSGIGYLLAKKYASKGAKLICINRNKEKSDVLSKEIETTYNVECRCLLADLSKMEDTHRVADELLNIDEAISVLIHNAGVFLTEREETDEGIEKVFMVHYLSSFIINYKLKDKLKAQERSRIILVNSEGHRFAVWGIKLDDLQFLKRRYSGMASYGSAKTAQLLSMLIFNEEFDNSGVSINAMHPGAVKSKTGQENGAIYKWYKKNIVDKTLKSADVSAEALYYLGVSKDIEGISGKYFNLTTLEEPTPPSLDLDVANQLWDISIKLGKLD